VPQGSVRSVLAGIAAVAVLAAGIYPVARVAARSSGAGQRWTARIRARSRGGHWALDLRVSLVVLFALAAVATRANASVLIAGFAAGGLLALLGEPRRLAEQLIGLGEGFLVPVFFVTLGAKLQLGALMDDSRNLVLTGALAAGTLLVHLTVAMLLRLPVGGGLLATAQLGVPAAAASLGLTTGLLGAGQAAAVLAAALASLAACSAGAHLLGHRERIGDRTAADHVRPAPT
jgi:Kef-type K+ transport system membrane component KefB